MTVPSYVDLDSVQRPTNGAQALPAWGDQVNDDTKHLYLTSSELLAIDGSDSGSPAIGTNKIYEILGFRHLGQTELTYPAAGFGSGSNYGYLTITFPTAFPTGFITGFTNGVYVVPSSGAQYGVPSIITGGSATEIVICFGPYTLTSGDNYEVQYLAKGY